MATPDLNPNGIGIHSDFNDISVRFDRQGRLWCALNATRAPAWFMMGELNRSEVRAALEYHLVFGIKPEDVLVPGNKILAKHMRLRDVVRMNLEGSELAPWSTCTVIQADDERVKLFRPYGVTCDFKTTSGVIPYTGVEEYTVLRDSTLEYILLERPKEAM